MQNGRLEMDGDERQYHIRFYGEGDRILFDKTVVVPEDAPPGSMAMVIEAEINAHSEITGWTATRLDTEKRFDLSIGRFVAP